MSVIIPCFNAAIWLPDTLQSVLAQTHLNIEVIVIDDGSTDNSWEVLSRYQDPRLRAIRQRNEGAAAARNAGLDLAKGEFIQYLDADDILLPDKLEAQLGDIDSMGNGWVSAARWGVFRRAPEEVIWQPLWDKRRQQGIEWLLHAWNTGDLVPTSAWLVPRDLAYAAGPWNPAAGINDDGEYFCRVLLKADGVTQTEGAFACYRVGNERSFSQRRDDEAFASVLRSFELCACHILRVEDSERVRNAIASLLLPIKYRAYPIFPDLVERCDLLLRELGLGKRVPYGGPASKLAGRVLGWKLVRRMGILLRA